MGTPRVEHTATLLPNGQVLVTGGRNSDGALASAELYSSSDQESPLPIAIDIKPGKYPNRISPSSQGNLLVAILTTPNFSAAVVETNTVLFGATGTEAAPLKSALQDLDRDGDKDLILLFRIDETNISCGDHFAFLTGETVDGQRIVGSDSIITIGCRLLR
jgi:hypothetical protein